MLPDIAKHSEKFYYFFEIANEGSLQATARKLGVSAPSLSHSIKHLESVVGSPLFIRSKSGVILTDAGEKLFTFCRRYYRDMEEVQRQIIHPEQQILRRLKIGTFQSIALYFWPLLIDSLNENQKISLSITTNRSKAILESLIKRNIDVALTVGTLKHERLIHHELYKDEYAFYCATSWKCASLKRIELNQMAVLYIPDAADETGRTLQQYLHSWGLSFRDEFELDSFEVIAEFTKKGYGIGVLPTRVAKRLAKEVRPIKIEGVSVSKFGTHGFFLSYRDDLDISQKMMSHLLEASRKAVVQLNS